MRHAHTSANNSPDWKLKRQNLENRATVPLGRWRMSPNENVKPTPRAAYVHPTRPLKGTTKVMNAGFGLKKWREEQLELLQKKAFYHAGMSSIRARQQEVQSPPSSPPPSVVRECQTMGAERGYRVEWRHRRIRARPGALPITTPVPIHQISASADRRLKKTFIPKAPPIGKQRTSKPPRFRSDSLQENERLREYGEQVLAQQHSDPTTVSGHITSKNLSLQASLSRDITFSSNELVGFGPENLPSRDTLNTDMLRMSPRSLQPYSIESLDNSEECTQASGVTVFFPRISRFSTEETQLSSGPAPQNPVPIEDKKEDKLSSEVEAQISPLSSRSPSTETKSQEQDDSASKASEFSGFISIDSAAAHLDSNDTLHATGSLSSNSRAAVHRFKQQKKVQKNNDSRSSKKTSKPYQTIKDPTISEADAKELRKLFDLQGLSQAERLALMNEESDLVETFETDSLSISDGFVDKDTQGYMTISSKGTLEGQPQPQPQTSIPTLDLSVEPSKAGPVVPPPSDTSEDLYFKNSNSLLTWREIVLCEALRQLNSKKHKEFGTRFDLKSVLEPPDKDGMVIVILPQKYLLQPGVPKISDLLDAAIILRVQLGELYENLYNVVLDMALEASCDEIDPEHLSCMTMQYFQPSIMKWLPMFSQQTWLEAQESIDKIQAGSILMVYSFLPKDVDFTQKSNSQDFLLGTKVNATSAPAPVSPQDSARKKRFLAEKMLVQLKYGKKSNSKKLNLRFRRMPVLKKSIMFGSSNLDTDVWNDT